MTGQPRPRLPPPRTLSHPSRPRTASSRSAAAATSGSTTPTTEPGGSRWGLAPRAMWNCGAVHARYKRGDNICRGRKQQEGKSWVIGGRGLQWERPATRGTTVLFSAAATRSQPSNSPPHRSPAVYRSCTTAAHKARRQEGAHGEYRVMRGLSLPHKGARPTWGPAASEHAASLPTRPTLYAQYQSAQVQPTSPNHRALRPPAPALVSIPLHAP